MHVSFIKVTKYKTMRHELKGGLRPESLGNYDGSVTEYKTMKYELKVQHT